MEILLVLALLACPIGMGLMMWFMGKDKGHGHGGASHGCCGRHGADEEPHGQQR